MTKQINKTKTGFTIIEVVLVLAIAGLIFMMVFLALPALQRSQRDTQRQNDISRLQTQLVQYQSNNRGRLPSNTITMVESYFDDDNQISGTAPTSSDWVKFYKNYLLAGGDTFEDPDGSPYLLKVEAWNAADTTKTIDEEFGSHTVYITTGAVCDGESAVKSTGARKVAIQYKREGGGVICINN